MGWSAADIRRLKRLWPDHTARQIARMMGRPHCSVKSKVTILRFRKRFNKEWTRAEISLLRELYPSTSSADLARRFGVKLITVYNRAHKLGLKKSKAYMAQLAANSRLPEFGKAFRFKKGHASFRPPKGVHYSPRTEFKKGNVPANIGKNGEIRIHTGDNYGTRRLRTYKWIRIRENKWRMLHVVVWEKKHGKIPRGMIVTFKDGNTMDVRLSNLQCITRAQHALNCQQSDGYVASRLAYQSGKGRGCRLDYDLMRRILKNKKLIEVKRAELNLRKKLKETKNVA